MERKNRICPYCKESYEEPPALSRIDNKTLICSKCGTLEALRVAGIKEEEQDKIMRVIYGTAKIGN